MGAAGLRVCGCGDFIEDGVGSGGRIGGLGDGSADDQEAGSGGDGGGGCCDTLLIADGGSCRANAGDDEGCAGEGCAGEGDFFRAADEAADTGVPGHGGEAGDLSRGWILDADGAELGQVHAGQDRNGEELGRLGQGVSGFGSGFQHGGSAAGVEGEEFGSGCGGGTDGSSDGVGDVVELEVEEDVEATIGKGGNDAWAFRDEEFQADLDPAAGGAEAFHKSEGGGCIREVEGDDEAILRRCCGSVHPLMIKAEQVVYLSRRGSTRDDGGFLRLRRVGNFGELSAGLDEVNAYAGEALLTHAEFARSGIREVDDAVFRDRTTVIYAQDDRLMILQVGDAHEGSERKRAMRAGELVHVEGLAAGCFLALEVGTVPGGDARLMPDVTGLCSGFNSRSLKRGAEGGGGSLGADKSGNHNQGGSDGMQVSSFVTFACFVDRNHTPPELDSTLACKSKSNCTMGLADLWADFNVTVVITYCVTVTVAYTQGLVPALLERVNAGLRSKGPWL